MLVFVCLCVGVVFYVCVVGGGKQYLPTKLKYLRSHHISQGP